jgi:hypothetical protein
MRKDDVEAGILSTMMMMTMAATTTTVGGLPRCPTGSGTSSRPPLKGTRQNLAPWGSQRPPRQDWDRPGGGGFRMPTTGPDDHHDPNGEKVEEGIEGGEDGRCDFEQASYVV